MARPIKKGLDYFPLDVIFEDEIELLEAEFGLVGFAILIKLWQKIYSNGYYIEWKSDSSLLFSKKINTDINTVESVINTCLRRNLFDKEIYDKYQILTSSGIQKRFLTAASQSKRKTISVISELILVNSEFTELITEETSFNPEFSTQRKVKESKVKEIKENHPPNPQTTKEDGGQNGIYFCKDGRQIDLNNIKSSRWKENEGSEFLKSVGQIVGLKGTNLVGLQDAVKYLIETDHKVGDHKKFFIKMITNHLKDCGL